MREGIVELYSDADLDRLTKQIRQRRAANSLIAAAALVACIAMIACADTRNAASMEVASIIVSTVAGWIVIYGSVFVVSVRRRELRHATMLHEEERQMVSGVVTVTDERVVIRRSITARRVEVRGEKEMQRLLVCESRAAALAQAGADTVYAVHGYVAAYEVSL